MQFWNWGPTTIWHNMTCVAFFSQNHSTLLNSAHTRLDSLNYVTRLLRLWSSDFYFILIIRFVFPLAFQHRTVFTTAKTREDTAKRMRKVGKTAL